MGVNRALIGRKYTQAKAVQIKPDMASAFANATGASADIYATKKNIIHPMFGVACSFHSLTAPLMDGELQADLMRLVHGEQKMTWHRMFKPGEMIYSSSMIQDIQTKESGETIIVGIESKDSDGHLVLKIESTLFIRGAKKKASKTESPDAFQNLQLFFQKTQTVEHDQSVRYAHASGDRNPIHLDDEAAQLAGLPSRILHGLCTMAFVHNALTEHGGGDPRCVKELNVRFARPVFMGDCLSIDVRHVDDNQDNNSHYAIRVTNQNGHRVLTNGLAKCS